MSGEKKTAALDESALDAVTGGSEGRKPPAMGKTEGMDQAAKDAWDLLMKRLQGDQEQP